MIDTSINFDLADKEITVQHIFNISPQSTNYRLINSKNEELWSGTELTKCKYRSYEVTFMRVVGSPYAEGYIELKIEEVDRWKGKN